MSAETYEVRPVATVVGGHSRPADDFQGGVESVIRMHSEFPLDTLRGLAEFSHLQVVWHFHQASVEDVALHARSPRGDARWPPSGTFVHRNHRRPNQLATSFPRLLRIEGRDLHVTDLDAVDGTPVLDIAPYFPQMGPRGTVRVAGWVDEMLGDYWKPAHER